MSWSYRNLSTSGNNSDLSSYSVSITPTSGKLILAWVYSIASSAPNIPTASGNNLTWVEVLSVPDGVGNRRITLFRAMGDNPVSGNVTFDFGGQTQVGCGWSIIEYGGVDTSGINGSGAVVQAVGDNSGGNATSLTITLAAFSSANNATAGGFGLPLNTSDLPTAGVGFTRTGQRNQNNPNLSIGSQFLAGNDTSVDMFSGSGNVPWCGIAVELKKAEDVYEDVFILAPSENIIDGDPTTAQLTPPEGKSSSDFTKGEILDESNSSGGIDIGEDGYTELEWVIRATKDAKSEETYEFRVLASAEPLDSYLETPEWIISERLSASHSFDAFISEVLTVPHTLDSLVHELLSGTHTLDALVVESDETSHSSDALIKEARTVTHSINAYVLTGNSAAVSLDALVISLQEVSNSVDAMVGEVLQATQSADALVSKNETVTESVDALVNARGTLTASIDALVNAREQGSHSTDALIVAQEAGNALVDALVAVQEALSHSVDAWVLYRQNAAHSADSLVSVRETGTHSMDAYVLVPINEAECTVDAYVNVGVIYPYTKKAHFPYHDVLPNSEVV